MNLLKRHIILPNEKKHMHMLRAMMRAIRQATHTLLFTTRLSAAARLLSSGTLLCGGTLLLCSALASCTPAEDVTDTGNPTLPADAEVPLSVQSVDIEGGLEVLTRTKEKTGATTKTSAATDTRAAGETRAAMPETRATTYTELKTKGDVINILRLSNDDYPTAITTGVKYRYNGTSWEPVSYNYQTGFTEDPTLAIKLGAKDSKDLLYAFYAPDSTYRFTIYNNGEISLNDISSILDMRWYKKGKENNATVDRYDICYSAAGEAQAVSPATEVYNFHPGVKFSMKRLFTQLGIKVTRGDNYAGVGEIGIIIWPKNAKFNSSGYFDTKTGTLTRVNPYGGRATSSHELGDPVRHYFDLPKAGDVYEDGVLMYPPGLQLDANMSMGNFSFVVDIEADGIKLADLSIPYSQLEMLMNASRNNFDMKAGTKYVLNLKLDYRSLELEGVQVAQWEAKTLADTEAGFELDLPGVGIQVAKADINETTSTIAGNAMACTENDKELLSQLIWASGNAKTHSSSPSLSYEWEAQQEGVGELYNWDTAVDICKYFGEEHYDLDPNLSNIDQFGTGWRLPTQTELDALSHCRGNEDASKNGAWFMNSTKGVLLPWTITQAGAGGRIVASNYWSGTESGSNAYCLRQASGGKQNTYITTMAKNEKNAVRCVKKPKGN